MDPDGGTFVGRGVVEVNVGSDVGINFGVDEKEAKENMLFIVKYLSSRYVYTSDKL